MVFGKQKLKDIAESVLPSEARKSARENLRNVKQKNRRSINRALARVGSIDDYYDDPRIGDLTFYPNAAIAEVVSDRRGADKLSVMRWAERRTIKEGITDPHDRYDFAKRALPNGLAGRHALTHIANVEGFCNGEDSYRSGCPVHQRPSIWRPSRSTSWTYEQIVAHFEELLGTGQHLALNATIKRFHQRGHIVNIPGTFGYVKDKGRWLYRTDRVICGGCEKPRVLAGHHDVKAWVADVFFPYSKHVVAYSWWRNGVGVTHSENKLQHHPEWKEAARKFMPEGVIS